MNELYNVIREPHLVLADWNKMQREYSTIIITL